jgi:hypothetical protein
MVFSVVGNNEVITAAEDAARWNDAHRLRILLTSQLENATALGQKPGCREATNVDSWRPALAAAIANNSLDALTVLIDAIGVDTSIDTTTGWTGLHVAAFLNAELVAQLFVAKGANMTLKSSVGQTPVEVATLHGNAEVLSVLAHPESVFAKTCACGTDFIEDSLFCRRCGMKRPVDASFDPAAVTVPDLRPHTVMPWVITKEEVGTQIGVGLGELCALGVQADMRPEQIDSFTQHISPVQIEASAQCSPPLQTEAFVQCIPSQVEASTQSVAPPALVDSSSQSCPMGSVDFASQCSLPAPGTCIETQTDTAVLTDRAVQYTAKFSRSLGMQTVTTEPSLSSMGVQYEADIVNSSAQTDAVASKSKGSQCQAHENFTRSCQTEKLKLNETSSQCGAAWSCYVDAEMQVEMMIVSTEDASMQVMLMPDSAELGVQMDGPLRSDGSTQCTLPEVSQISGSSSMAQPSAENILIPPTEKYLEPNKAGEGVSLEVVGVGREIIWRFNDHGAAINSFRNPPVANLQVGDMLVKINDVSVEGLPKEQVMKLWKTHKGMSEHTTLHFRRLKWLSGRSLSGGSLSRFRDRVSGVSGVSTPTPQA